MTDKKQGVPVWWGVPLVGMLALDQWTKWFVWSQRDRFYAMEIIPDFFYLTYLENRGAAFSILQDFRWGFIVLTIVALVFMVRFFLSQKNWVSRVSLTLLMAGAIGNMIDRARQGFVVDFLHFYPFGYSFPVFNFADIYIVVGAILLAVWLLFMYREPEAKNENNK